MNNIFLENEKKTSRLILYINWVACCIGYALVLLSKILGLARITYISLFLVFITSMLMLVIAEVLYYFLVKKANSKTTLKYFIIFITCVALSLILYAEGNPYIIGVFFYGLIAAALYYDVSLFLFSCGMTLLLIFVLVSNNHLDMYYRVNSITFLLDLFRSSIISVVLLGEFLRKSKKIISTIKKQEEELGRLNLSLESMVSERTEQLVLINQELLAHQQELSELNLTLESKVEERTEQLLKTNEELNSQQKKLTSLNNVLTQSNQEIEKAYKELASTETKLIQHEKMASLGMLVAGVVHEINTPLGAINCSIDSSKTLLSYIKSNNLKADDEKLTDIIMKIDKSNNISEIACKRISEIVKKLKEFSRLDEGEIKYVDINSTIDNVTEILSSRFNDRIEIIKNYVTLPEIECYPNQISELLFNVLLNAMDAIKQTGVVWINTEYGYDKIYIRIKDNGIGIKEDQLKKIFDPGFTTKGVGVGTGLGLAIAYNIVESHKGKISVNSEQGKGTEFLIELPLNLEHNK